MSQAASADQEMGTLEPSQVIEEFEEEIEEEDGDTLMATPARGGGKRRVDDYPYERRDEDKLLDERIRERYIQGEHELRMAYRIADALQVGDIFDERATKA